MKMNLWMLGIAAMLASCSSEDLLQGTNADSDVVHITAQLADGMKTRMIDEDLGESASVNRYVLNAYEVGTDGQVSDQKANVVITNLENGNFTAKLDRKKKYKFYCWADEGDKSSYNITGDDLSSITLKENTIPTIAHRGVSDEVSGATDATVAIRMAHAVAKAVLQTTSNLAANTAKLSTKTYSTYNAIKEEVSGDKTDIEVMAADATEASKENPVEVLKFYTLIGKKETLPVTISYTTVAENFDNAKTYTYQFSNAPFQTDYRTVFKGDIAGLQYSTASVTATLNKYWKGEYPQGIEAEVDEVNHRITTFNAGQLKKALIEQAVADETGITLTLSGPMDDTDAWALQDYFCGAYGVIDTHVSTLDMSGVTGQTTIRPITFSNTPNLKNVILPASVTKIEKNAFEFSGLETITADYVTTVEYMVFRYCKSLKELSLPSVTTLSDSREVFGNCTNLTTLKLTSPNFDGKFGDECFKGVSTEKVDLYVHEKLKSNVNKVSDPDGSVVYKFKNSQNGEYITFKSITLVADNGNVVPFE
ncbi:leucine-rich repeat domain-containing protein [Prevotella merdae]|uniref:leucine-rich repeat domain-containing protein n=1 Tax=Prevotella merdae TaxID=2079531 RepID=UPI00356704D3